MNLYLWVWEVDRTSLGLWSVAGFLISVDVSVSANRLLVKIIDTRIYNVCWTFSSYITFYSINMSCRPTRRILICISSSWWSAGRLREKLIIVQLVRFTARCSTRSFICVLRAHHWTVTFSSWVSFHLHTLYLWRVLHYYPAIYMWSPKWSLARIFSS
jgi:hypothetical protein